MVSYTRPLQLLSVHPAAADRLMPTNLSRKGQPATSHSSSTTRSEGSCLKDKHLSVPSVHSLETREIPDPRKEPVPSQGTRSGHAQAQVQGARCKLLNKPKCPYYLTSHAPPDIPTPAFCSAVQSMG